MIILLFYVKAIQADSCPAYRVRLFEMTGIFTYRHSKKIGAAFRIEPVIGNAFFPAQLTASGKIAPKKRGDSHNGQKQRTKDRGLDGVTELVYLHLRLPCKVVFVQKQKHAHTKTAADLPGGDDAAVVLPVGTIAVNAIENESNQGLRESPGPLPEPE